MAPGQNTPGVDTAALVFPDLVDSILICRLHCIVQLPFNIALAAHSSQDPIVGQEDYRTSFPTPLQDAPGFPVHRTPPETVDLDPAADLRRLVPHDVARGVGTTPDVTPGEVRSRYEQPIRGAARPTTHPWRATGSGSSGWSAVTPIAGVAGRSRSYQPAAGSESRARIGSKISGCCSAPGVVETAT